MTRRCTSSRIVVAVSILVLLPQVAHSNESEQQLGVAREMVRVLEAYAVYKMGQYDLAFERYQALAEAGSHQGMYNLANMYAAGQGVEQSDSEAFRWYLKAARAGNRLSMEEVARAYADGTGIAVNPIQAHHWQARAAEP